MEHRYYSQVDQVGTRADMHLFIQNLTDVLPLTRKLTLAEAAFADQPHNVWGSELAAAAEAGRATA